MTDDNDFVWGARGIAQVINRSVRATNHMLTRGVLPARKAGPRLYVASRRELVDPNKWPGASVRDSK
jgi:hypothetical protein